MRHQDQVAHIKTLLAHLDSGTNVDAGGLRQNPTFVYSDADLARRELQEFFATHPQMIGLGGELPEPGSFMTVDDLTVPILATRDSGGRFRAFVNACRHRGVVLEQRERGATRRFTCMFHGWTYDTDGSLVGIPKLEHFGDVDLDCLGLVELPSVEQYGMLWVHPEVDGSIDVDALLGDELVAELVTWQLHDMERIGSDTYDTACNWKLAMDTFGETYHFPTLHKNTLAASFYGNAQCYDTFGRNHRMILCRRDIDQYRDLPEDEWDITIAGTPVYWLFPNVQLLLFSGGAQVVRAYPHPDDPGRHVSQISFYLRADLERSEADIEIMKFMAERFGSVIRDEDYVVSASQQRNANAGSLPHVVFGRNEPALHHYHNTYRAALGMELLPLIERVGADS